MSDAVHFLFGYLSRRVSGAVFAALATLGIFASGCNWGQAAAAAPTSEVEVATVEQRDVAVYREWVATLDGYVNAQIRAQASGYITEQNYTEGSLVRKGQVLFEIDPRPFTAALDRAKGDLAQAQAQLGKSTLDVERDKPLAEAMAIAKSQLKTRRMVFRVTTAIHGANVSLFLLSKLGNSKPKGGSKPEMLIPDPIRPCRVTAKHRATYWSAPYGDAHG